MSGPPIHPAKRTKLAVKWEEDYSLGFAWKMCNHMSIEDRIAFKENAVQRADIHTDRLCELLLKYAKDDCTPGAESLQNWIHHIGQYPHIHSPPQSPQSICLR